MKPEAEKRISNKDVPIDMVDLKKLTIDKALIAIQAFKKGGPGSGIKGHKTHRELLKEKYMKVTPEDVKEQLVKKWNKELFKDEKLCDGVKYWGSIVGRGYTTQSMNKINGHYSPSRIAIHDKIIQHFLKDSDSIRVEPKVIFFGGASGSGKSGLLKYVKNLDDFTYVNNDDIKEMLPEYEGVNSQFVHDEARDIVEKLEDVVIENNGNLIIDGTMKSHDKSIALYEKYRALGYEIVQLSTNLPLENTIERAVNRAKGSTGRYVPLKMIANMAEQANINQFEILKLADKGAIFDTNVKQGQPYKVIARQ